MVTKTLAYSAGHFIVSEANKTRSREQIMIAAGEVLPAGSVLAKNSDTGEYEGYNNDGTNVTNAAAGILFDNVDATDGPVRAVAIVREAEVNWEELQWGDTEDTGDREAARADLLALQIIGR